MTVTQTVERPIDRHPCTTESCGFRTSSPAAAGKVAAQTLARDACSLQQNHEHFSVLPLGGQGSDVTSSGVRASAAGRKFVGGCTLATWLIFATYAALRRMRC